MDRWREYLYRGHSEDELSEWAKELHQFRFCRAIGGHANDGDELVVALRYSSAQDLENLWRELGATGNLEGRSQIKGIQTTVLVLPDRVLLFLFGASGDPFEVTSTDVANAKALDLGLPTLKQRAIDPPVDSQHCISPKHYPEFWTP